MSDTLQRQRAVPGEVIFREGDAGERAYVIENGRVAITSTRSGSEVVLATLRSGDLFGEMALIDEQARSATAQAVDATSLIVIGREQVMRKIDHADPLIKMFLRVILGRLRRTSELVGDTSSRGAARVEDLVEDTGFRRIRQQAIEMLDREHAIEQGLDSREFEMFYQPIVNLADGCSAGFEAVMRWRRGDGSIREPDSFVALAEEAGLMPRLTRTALAGACRAIPPLRDAMTAAFPAGRAPFVSLNLTAGELAAETLVETIMNALSDAAVDPTRLQVEVTESDLMQDPELAASVLRRLKTHGITVSVDDFGTGYSSLSYLQHLPIDVLKIDRSFVAALPLGAGSRKIVRAVARLARELGMITVAEGVERPDELTLVREYGCDLAQGFLFSPPLPLAGAIDVARLRFALEGAVR